ncbi:hypothetical protein [Ferruginibacter sp. HRS2-29]|uniref:hypothetical protein n=1 Tax=Ferruginibacter sp. HRS2-29 TaxID=2487334 RepID=UPI0020CE8F41|nr:hypothetical protein [Ferruginibacter sp. HRS2-29]MCP9753249.1 hypothetical protein [Ferruginibacter sp. HRS2-29]
MDIYKQIEIEIAHKHGAVAEGTKKAIGDFLLNNNIHQPVNVKSNNLAKKNYSPNIISAMKLIKWLQEEGNELYFIFVDYNINEDGLKMVKDSGLIAIQNISWNCLTIEAQGWGVIQMCRPLEVDMKQDLKGFFAGMKNAYEIYMAKEAKKVEIIKEMIKDF